MSTAISWFFEQEERGIILEDDCVPNLDFFTFCETYFQLFENLFFLFAACQINPIRNNNNSSKKY